MKIGWFAPEIQAVEGFLKNIIKYIYILCVPERSYQNFDTMLLKKLQESDNTCLLSKM